LRKIPLVTFSSDLVFNGGKTTPYVETDPVCPLNVYGISKAAAEKDVLGCNSQALVVRTSSFFGPWDPHNFLTRTLRVLREGGAVEAMDDVVISATYVPDLVNAALDLLIDGECGVWHLANRGAVTWLQLAARTATLANIGSQRLHAVKSSDAGFSARRPKYSALGSERGLLLPDLEDALLRYVEHTRELAVIAAA
jgi:dTDP-4-dehydrorhamnose reductase